jgi:hypothetical protein
MEDSITQGDNNSRSASEKGVSDTEQKKPGSGSGNSSKPIQNQEGSTTPKTMPPHGSQQQFVMGPPPKPNFKATPTSAQPSKSMSQVSSQGATQELPAASSQTVENGDDQPAAPSKHPTNNTMQATSARNQQPTIKSLQTRTPSPQTRSPPSTGWSWNRATITRWITTGSRNRSFTNPSMTSAR